MTLRLFNDISPRRDVCKTSRRRAPSLGRTPRRDVQSVGQDDIYSAKVASIRPQPEFRDPEMMYS